MKTTKFRMKRRNRYLGNYVVPNGLGLGLIWKEAYDQWHVPWPWAQQTMAERIEYTYNGSKTAFNKCDRYQSSTWGLVNPKRISLWKNTAIGWVPGGDMWHEPLRHWDEQPYRVFFNPYGNPKSLDYTDKLQSRVFDSAQAVQNLGGSTHMNVLRSAFELKDTKQTLVGIRSLLEWACTVGRGRIKPAATMFEVAGAYLTYQFGIAPTVSDVKKFVSEVSSQKLKIYAKPRKVSAGDLVRVGYKLEPSDEDLTALCGCTPIREQTLTDWIGSNGVFTKWDTSHLTAPYCPLDWYYGLTRVVVKKYKGTLFARAQKTIRFDSVDSRLRDWEWSCPVVKTLWDLTPFSFLIDWFLGIGDVIERLEKQVLIARSDGVLQQVWHSANSSLVELAPTVNCFSRNVLLSTPSDYPMWYVAVLNRSTIGRWVEDGLVKEYHREPYVAPLTAMLPTLRWPVTAYQLSTGAALVVNLCSGLRSMKRLR